MERIVVETRPVVFDRDAKDPFLLRALREVAGRWFWQVAKADQVVTRLLLGSTPRGERPLSETDIIERLIRLRDDVVDKLANPPPEEDLGIEVDRPKPMKRKPVAFADLPKIVTIDAPTIDDAEGQPFQALTSTGGRSLWLELTPAAIDYLQIVCRAQVESKAIKKRRQSAAAPCEPGVSYEKRRDAYRARRPGNNEQKYFRQRDYADAASSASGWLAKLEHPPLADAPPPPEGDALPLPAPAEPDGSVEPAPIEDGPSIVDLGF